MRPTETQVTDDRGLSGLLRRDAHGVSAVPHRVLIFHYHLFKNAGTSVDEMLRQNFGARWAEHEFPGSGARKTNVESVALFLRGHSELAAFSSHTALLPAPQLDGVFVFPVIFVRHPIDRLHSAYVFERMQVADTPGARLAKEHDFAGYVRELLSHPRKRQARSFQTFRMAMNEPAGSGSDLERAMRALQSLPFIGLVEEFEKSLKRLEALLKPLVPQFRAIRAERNVKRSRGASLEERLTAIAAEIGSDLYEELNNLNADDLTMHSAVRARYVDGPAAGSI